MLAYNQVTNNIHKRERIALPDTDVRWTVCSIPYLQDKKDFIEKRIKRMLKAGVTSALTVMVKADSSVLTDQTKELLSR